MAICTSPHNSVRADIQKSLIDFAGNKQRFAIRIKISHKHVESFLDFEGVS